jgi:hypothetical protein
MIMKMNLANLAPKFNPVLKGCLVAFLFFVANETSAQMEACWSNFKTCTNQTNIQFICETKSDEAVGKCVMESGGGSCLAEKIISNSSNWGGCAVVGNQVNWTLFDQQNRAIQACFPSRNQIFNSCMQNFYANPLSWPQSNPLCSMELNRCLNNTSPPSQPPRP